MNNDVLKELVESDRRHLSFVLTAMPGWYMTSTSNHLKWILKVSKADNSVLTEISGTNLEKGFDLHLPLFSSTNGAISQRY